MMQPFYPEGLDPRLLGRLIHTPLAADSPLILRADLKGNDFNSIPMVNLNRQFLVNVQKTNGLDLTEKGTLHLNFIQQLYDLQIVPPELSEGLPTNFEEEKDYFPIHFAHTISRKAGLIQNKDGQLFLSKKGEKTADDPVLLYRELIIAFTSEYDWAYLTSSPPDIAQTGWAYVMYLFLQYGNTERDADFYATKYLELFPAMLEPFRAMPHNNPVHLFKICFRNRFFSRFGLFFGLVTLREIPGDSTHKRYLVKKSDLVDKVFALRPGVREN